jgi:glucose/mannose-6-phosphate isomerase
LTIIDDIEKSRAIDQSNMYNRIFDLPEHMEDALKTSTGLKVDAAEFPGIANIVVVGMGGSAIGGDLARTLLASRLLVPFFVCRHYTLPEFVDDESLVIASSYSGNTEETLSAVNDALSRKAMLMALTTGGLLADVAKLNDIPVMPLPPGLQPRAAIGYSFVPLVMFLEKIGVVKDISQQIAATARWLKVLREHYIEDEPAEKNPAKQLAQKIQGRIPIIYGGPTLTDVVAVRWKGQFCENAKNMAFANQYAEFNHNELVGYSDLIKKHHENLIAIQLRDADDHPKITRRMDIVHRLIRARDIEVIEVPSQGEGPMARMFSLLHLGDFVSYYLAILNEVDPTPVEPIENLKRELSS